MPQAQPEARRDGILSGLHNLEGNPGSASAADRPDLRLPKAILRHRFFSRRYRSLLARGGALSPAHRPRSENGRFWERRFRDRRHRQRWSNWPIPISRIAGDRHYRIGLFGVSGLTDWG